MILESFRYSQYEGELQEWRLETVVIGLITLLVGKNASGKSRTLNVVNGLARLLSGESKLTFKSGDYWARFREGDSVFEYTLRYSDSKVQSEAFTENGKILLKRGAGGLGQILAVKNDTLLDFQTPEGELASVNRRDLLQHPFFERLHAWGNGVRHFQFGTPLGKDHLAFLIKEDKTMPFDPRDTAEVIAIFRRGHKEFGTEFETAIIADMCAIGYDLQAVGVRPPQSLSIAIQSSTPGELVGLYVKEKALLGFTDQVDMSQGMFRALSIIIQLNYSQRSDQPSCILIDDIGEGLDFERSCALIDLLMHKTQETGVQLIMSTNDRFVMNKVPLEFWSVIQRQGNTCRFFNYQNSAEKFETFRFTGMNNFDFFASDFIHSNLNEEVGDLR